jgi:hypothetical protein
LRTPIAVEGKAPSHAIRIGAYETRVTVRIMENTARATYVRYRTERAIPGNLWSRSGRIFCPSRAALADATKVARGRRGSPRVSRHGRLAPASSTQSCEGLVVKERTAHPRKFPPLGRRAGLNVAPPRSATANGIEVHEEKWGTVTVQHVYKMRCECGRSWFELELPRFVRCPACHQLDFVSA